MKRKTKLLVSFLINAVVALSCVVIFGFVFFNDPVNQDIDMGLKVKVFIFFIALYFAIVAVLFLFVFGPNLMLMSSLETISKQALGPQYSYLIRACVKDFRVLPDSMLCDLAENYIFTKLFNPYKIYSVGRLSILWERNRKKALTEIYVILKNGGDKVPKGAWREFIERNPEVSELNIYKPETEFIEQIESHL